VSTVAGDRIEDRRLFAELWLSFGSVVRAYAAAAPVTVGPAPDVESTGETIRVTAGAARLEFCRDPKTGAGNWQLTSGEARVAQGRFQLLSEGRIDIEGKALDLDHAAIDLVALAMNAAANPARDK
jgi:hypothetical protein